MDQPKKLTTNDVMAAAKQLGWNVLERLAGVQLSVWSASDSTRRYHFMIKRTEHGEIKVIAKTTVADDEWGPFADDFLAYGMQRVSRQGCVWGREPDTGRLIYHRQFLSIDPADDLRAALAEIEHLYDAVDKASNAFRTSLRESSLS